MVVEKNIIEIENKINEDVKKSIDESQKEYYLREKMPSYSSLSLKAKGVIRRLKER